MGVPNKLRQPEPIHRTTADVEDFQVPPIKPWNFEVSRVMPPKRQRRWKIVTPIKLNSFEAEKTGGCEVVGRSCSFLFFVFRCSMILLVLGRVLSGHNHITTFGRSNIMCCFLQQTWVFHGHTKIPSWLTLIPKGISIHQRTRTLHV